MSIVDPPAVMTTEQMLALPDDGVDRELINGQLRERPVTKRNRWHSQTMAQIASLLVQWLERQPEPRGQIVGGEAGFRLRRDPDTTVGIDVAYVSAETLAKTPEDSVYFEGPPVLAVEILSPSDSQKDIAEKIHLYLNSGVALVWIVDPEFHTVVVHRLGAEPTLFSESQEITADSHLPGLRVSVAKVFHL